MEGTSDAGERENRPELSPQPDPLTQAAQHKCFNPLLSTSNKAFTRTHVAHVPPSTWYYCTTLTQLAFHAVTPFWACLTYSTQDQASICFYLSFSPLTGLYLVWRLARVLQFLVFACVCADKTRCTVFYWPTYSNKPFAPEFPPSFLWVVDSVMRDRCCMLWLL